MPHPLDPLTADEIRRAGAIVRRDREVGPGWRFASIELKEPVYAWFGGFKGMNRIDAGEQSKRDADKEAKGSSANLPGGGTQFYIPNLKVVHIKETYSIKPL